MPMVTHMMADRQIPLHQQADGNEEVQPLRWAGPLDLCKLHHTDVRVEPDYSSGSDKINVALFAPRLTMLLLCAVPRIALVRARLNPSAHRPESRPEDRLSGRGS